MHSIGTGAGTGAGTSTGTGTSTHTHTQRDTNTSKHICTYIQIHREKCIKGASNRDTNSDSPHPLAYATFNTNEDNARLNRLFLYIYGKSTANRQRH